MYIDKLDELENKYSNANQSTIKIKPVDFKDITYIDSGKKSNHKILNLKLVIMLEHRNTKKFLPRVTHSKLVCDYKS